MERDVKQQTVMARWLDGSMARTLGGGQERDART